MQQRTDESSEDALSLGRTIQELHEAASEAATQGFPHVAFLLDECGFAFAADLITDDSDWCALVARARRCLEAWHQMRRMNTRRAR
jgi:hypothetical protein